MTPHIDAGSPDFPGDPKPQPPFGLRDSMRSLPRWVLGLSQLAAWMGIVRVAAETVDLRRADFLLKWMTKSIPATLGIQIDTLGSDAIDPGKPYVYVSNHVNIFDMFALYQAIPQYTRALEHIDHFSWPFIGPLITAAGQIPVDPDNPRLTAKGLKTAKEMLDRGESLTVLAEGSRTLDGSLGPFLPGAFRLAIKSRVPVVPIALRGGRAISRRGDWRVRPGRQEVCFAAPIPTKDLRISDSDQLAEQVRQTIIDLLHRRRTPGT